MSGQLQEYLENMEYDYQIGMPVRYKANMTIATSLVSLAKNQDEMLSYLEAATTPEILSFSDQLSREDANELSSIKSALNEVIKERNASMSVQTEEMGKGMGSM